MSNERLAVLIADFEPSVPKVQTLITSAPIDWKYDCILLNIFKRFVDSESISISGSSGLF